MFQKDTTSGGEVAWHGRVLGKEWAERVTFSKARNVVLADPVFGKIEFGRRSGRMKPIAFRAKPISANFQFHTRKRMKSLPVARGGAVSDPAVH